MDKAGFFVKTQLHIVTKAHHRGCCHGLHETAVIAGDRPVVL